MKFYKNFLKPILFLFDPEKVHHFVCLVLKVFCSIPGVKPLLRTMYQVKDSSLEIECLGLRFPNRIGLAAGFDKNAKLFTELSCLGFGFIEIGTVTPLAQPGNEKPRMFRLPEADAIINRMGFNNDGAVQIAKRLKGKHHGIVIGGNIGKNKSTSIEMAGDDYEKCFRELFDAVDYFVVNVSSPNTPGLRTLQEKEPLKKILFRLQELNSVLTSGSSREQQQRLKPILLKISPDLSDEQLDEIIEVVLETKLDGIIATNTTIARDLLKSNSQLVEQIGAGGLSGVPVCKRSTEIIRYLAERSSGKFVIIGVGGIHSAADAREKIKAGATLIQLYTGFIYEGPGIVKRINRELLKSI